MKCIDIEIAVANLFGIRKNIIVPNVSWGAGLHECDLLILKGSGYAVEVEIKVSKSDLKKDLQKQHAHQSQKLKELYFAIPENLLQAALEILPPRTGIITCKVYEGSYYPDKVFASIHRKATKNKDCLKWTEQEIYNVSRLGCMRIWTLKKAISGSHKTTTT